MKKFFSFLTLGLLLAAFGCVKEKDSGQPEEPMTMVEVPVDIGEAGYSGADTKSLISIEAERFQKGALFAFDATSHKILLYQGSPIVKTTESKTFSWSLPVNVKMNIYIIANYGDLDLSDYLANTSLTESDLQSLTFICANGTQLKQLEQEGYGLPMAGIKYDVTLTPNNTSLSLKVKKLFARYDFYFNASALTDAGYSVHSLYISASKSNTEVPYFVEGYKQTAVSKLNVVDLGTPEDIEELNYASSGHAITLYFLENCQGDKAGAAHWYDVASANLPGINLCSYIDLGIKATDSNGFDSNFFYWIYLGDDCHSNFDVRRNEYRTIKLNLQTPEVVPPTQGIKIIPDYSTLASTLPNGCRFYFETSLSEAELTARSASDQLNASISGFSNDNERDVTGYAHSGYVDITPVSGHNMTAAISSTVTVGKWDSNSWKVSDQHEVNLAGEALYITLTDNEKSWSWDSYGSSSAKVAKVSTNIARANLSVSSNNDSNVSYTLATTPNGDGTYDLSMYWKSSNTSNSDRTATITVSGSSKSGTAQMTQTGKPEDVITYTYKVVTTVSPTTIYVGNSATASAELFRRTYTNGTMTTDWTSQGSVTDSGFTAASGSSYVSISGSTITGSSAGNATIKSKYSADEYSNATLTVQSDSQTGTEYKDVAVSISASPTTIPYGGGTSTLSYNATYKYRAVYASGSYGNWTDGSGTPTISGSATGFTRNGTTVTVAANSGDARSVTYYADFSIGDKTATQKSVTITQSKYVPTVTYELQLSGNSSALVGNNIQLTATYITKSDGTPISQTNVTSSATYTRQSGSSNISVSSSGSVSAVNPGGTATIRASYSGYTADHSVTFNLNSGFEWITPNNQSVDEGKTITLEFWSSTNSVSITSNNSKLSVGTPSYTSQSGTSNPWAYRGSVVLTAGDIDDDITVTITGPDSKTRTINVIAQWNVGFEWDDNSSVSIDAGGSQTYSYYCSSASPTISSSNTSVVTVTKETEASKSHGYRYSGVATITANSNANNGATASVTGSVSGSSNQDTKAFTVSNNTTTYALVLAAVGSTSGVFGSYIPIKAYFKTYTGGVETASTDVTMAASYSGPSNISISKNGQNLEARVSSSSVGTYTITGTFTPSPQVGQLSGTISLTFNDLIEYDLRIEQSAYSTEVGNSITLTAYYDTYTNNVKTNSQNVTSSCTWGKSGTGSSYVSVSGGVVTATKSCTYAGVGSYTITCSYNAAGKSKNHSVVFNPHVTQVSYYWKGIREVDHTTYKVRIKTSCNLPCDVTFTHNGGSSYAGYNGMVVSKGTSESSEYTFTGNYLPALNGSGTPNSYYVNSEDRTYEFHTVGQSDITYL